MKIYVNFSFWSIEVTRGRLRPHFDCDLEWPPNIALWVLFPNNSKFFYVTSCDRFPIGHLGRQMTVGTPSNSICNQNSASDWPRMTSNWKSIATFYIKKTLRYLEKVPTRLCTEVIRGRNQNAASRVTSDDLGWPQWFKMKNLHIFSRMLKTRVIANGICWIFLSWPLTRQKAGIFEYHFLTSKIGATKQEGPHCLSTRRAAQFVFEICPFYKARIKSI